MIALSLAMAACLAANPNSDEIVARDLLPRFAQLAEIDPLTRLAFAPAPGATRVFGLPELRQIAQRFALSGSPGQEICVQHALAPLTSDGVLTAMRAALPAARIEILDYSRRHAPAGPVEFPIAGLRRLTSPASGAIWDGFIRYAVNRKFPVWARVQVTVAVQRVVAIGDLEPGRPIEPGQILLQTREEFPAAGKFADSLEQVAGKCPRHALRAGTEIRTADLASPREILHGDTVKVDVFAGAAHLEFEGVAEGSGAVGEMIPVRNPSSNKRFRARVEGKGRVSVGSGPKESL